MRVSSPACRRAEAVAGVRDMNVNVEGEYINKIFSFFIFFFVAKTSINWITWPEVLREEVANNPRAKSHKLANKMFLTVLRLNHQSSLMRSQLSQFYRFNSCISLDGRRHSRKHPQNEITVRKCKMKSILGSGVRTLKNIYNCRM